MKAAWASAKEAYKHARQTLMRTLHEVEHGRQALEKVLFPEKWEDGAHRGDKAVLR